jgi:branched-chain amino acid transport system ATP-binding protein
MLELHDLHVDIASAQVLRGFSMQVPTGHMVGLVGRNGAGKTSTMRSIMGHLPLRQGQIHLDGQSLSALPPEARAGLGIGYMPEDRGLVPELTVEENMLIPLWVSKNLNLQARLNLVYQVLPELQDMALRRALLLSGGQQKLVALGRALAVGTRLLLLDEPFEGPGLVHAHLRGVAPTQGRGFVGAGVAIRPEPRQWFARQHRCY